MVWIRPVADCELELVAGWLARPEVAQWLDFGAGRAAPDTIGLKLLTVRQYERVFVYGPPGNEAPVGVVGLSAIHPRFSTAMLWYALGLPAHVGQGLTTCAAAAALVHGFREFGLAMVNAWAVESNAASVRVLEKVGFRQAGRLRRCHPIGGEPHDRLLFDILPHEITGPSS